MSAPAKAPKILAVCVGNPDCGDDGIGPMVAQALAGRLPDSARLVVRSGDMLALAEDCAGFDAMICVDAAASLGCPGRIHRIDLSAEDLPPGLLSASTHGFGLADAIALTRTLGRAPRHIAVYAAEGVRFRPGDAMTPELAGAAGEIADRVAAEIAGICAGARS
jgi:hydrogenase maturation protease